MHYHIFLSFTVLNPHPVPEISWSNSPAGIEIQGEVQRQTNVVSISTEALENVTIECCSVLTMSPLRICKVVEKIGQLLVEEGKRKGMLIGKFLATDSFGWREVGESKVKLMLGSSWFQEDFDGRLAHWSTKLLNYTNGWDRFVEFVP